MVDAVFVTYTDGVNSQPLFAETRGTGGAVTGTWDSRYLNSPSGTGVYTPPVAVGGAGGKAQVVLRFEQSVGTIRQN